MEWHSTRSPPFACFCLFIDCKNSWSLPYKTRQTYIYDGIFLGYDVSSRKNVMYLDVHSGCVIVGGYFNFDEAHYTSTLCPPGLQFPFDLGLQTSIIPVYSTGAAPALNPSYVPFPPFTGNCIMNPIPTRACNRSLPFFGVRTTHSTCYIMVLMLLLSTFPHMPYLDMLILTRPWIFTTATLSQLFCLQTGWCCYCLEMPTPTSVSLSSTDAEFFAATDAGKMALYLYSILDEPHVPQIFATLLYEDN